MTQQQQRGKLTPVPAMSDRSEHNRSKATVAQQSLINLMERGEAEDMYGLVAVEVYFERGSITHIRKRSEGTQK